MYGMDKEIDTKDVYGLICPIDCKFCDEFDNQSRDHEGFLFVAGTVLLHGLCLETYIIE